jgi:type VI secretion system secreted protein VgrG
MQPSKQSARYELTISGVPDVRPYAVQYTGALNQPYRLEVHCSIADLRKEGVQDVTQNLRGKDCTFRVWRDTPDRPIEQKIRGVVIAARREGRSNIVDEEGEEKGWILEHDDGFVIEIGPALELLKFDAAEPKTWHNKTYKDVLQEVLDKGLAKYGRSLRNEIQRDDIVDIITQVPQESDLEFVQNLLTEAGINAFFDHSGDREELILSDENGSFLEGELYQDPPLQVRRNMSGNLAEWVYEFKTRTDSSLSEVKFKSYDQVQTPSVLLEKFEANPISFLTNLLGGGGGGGGSGGTGVVQNWEALRPNEVGDPEEQFKKATEVQNERVQTELLKVDAQSGVIGMLEGRTFEVEAQPGDARKYVVESVSFHGIKDGDLGGHGGPSDFISRAVMVPLTNSGGGAVKIRATAEQQPRKMAGLSLAEIVAIETHPVEVDKLMRCRFRFLWDETGNTPQATWVTMLQPMAGRFGGTQYIPREGDRVCIAFLEGNRNLAVILGCLYDEEFRPPYLGPPGAITLPESDLMLGFSYASVERGGGPGGQGSLDRHSMMAVDVSANKEMFYFNAPWDWRQDIGNDCEINIENHRTETVKGNWTLGVEGTHEETVKGAKTETYKGGVKTEIDKGWFECTHSGDRTIWVNKGSARIFATKAINIVAPDVTISESNPGGCGGQGPAAGASVRLAQAATVQGPREATLESGPSRARVNPNAVVIETPGSASVTTPQGTRIEAGVTRVEAQPDRFTVQSTQSRLQDPAGGSATLSNGAFVVDVPQGITLRCGATELRLSPEGVFINGQQVQINATNAEIHAQRVDITGDRTGDGRSEA